MNYTENVIVINPTSDILLRCRKSDGRKTRKRLWRCIVVFVITGAFVRLNILVVYLVFVRIVCVAL